MVKTSDKVTVTDAKLKALLKKQVISAANSTVQKTVKKAVDNEKIKTGKVTKFYPYLDKAEVKIDKTKKKVLCKVLHRFAGGLIDFFTPLGDNSYCETLKEPCILPRDNLHACIADINDDTKEYLLLGYYYPDDIVGFEPASIGAMKIISFGASKENYIEFSGAGLKIQTSKEVEMETGEYNTDTVEVHHAHVEDVYSKDEIDDKLGEDGEVYGKLLNVAEDYKELSDNSYYLFRGDCWSINNNYESSAAITSESHEDFTVTGTFRTHQDMIGIYWYAKDIITHPYISYGEKSDFSNVTLEADVEFSNCLFDTKTSTFKSTFTIKMKDGSIYYLVTKDYMTYSGNNKHLKLNFNKLVVEKGSDYIDSKGNTVTASDPFILDVSDVEFLMFVLIPPSYNKNESVYTIRSNLDYSFKLSNITVSNGFICKEHVKLAPHKYRLCEGYDDFYNLNPYRVTREMRKLGYTEWVDLYIGASHFYEKSGTIGDTIDVSEFNHTRTEKMVLDKNVPLNKSFIAWLDCYSRELKNNDCPNLVVSVSMENLQCPQSWRQRDVNGNFALTGWVPSTFFYSPCHEEVAPYMQSVSEACLDIVVANGMQPILQMGEAWWWWNEWSDPTNAPPCFYDDSTKAKYLAEHGRAIPEYSNRYVTKYDHETMYWLNQQLCQYSDALREIVKSDKYTDGLYMALFFPPSVLDEDRVPAMMKEANFLEAAYSPAKLDVLQIEDYDWVTGNPLQPELWERDRSHHHIAYEIGQKLGFSEDRLHYFGGFVQYPKNAKEFWRLIKQSMDDAISKGFKEVFVWAGSQVRRDHKILGYDNYELVQDLTSTTSTTIIKKVKSEDNIYIDDIPMGWQEFPRTENFYNISDDTKLRYHRGSGVIQVKGKTQLVANESQASKLLVGILPPGFRPQTDQYFFDLKGAQADDEEISYRWVCCIRHDGKVYAFHLTNDGAGVTPYPGTQFFFGNNVVFMV